MLVSEDRVDSAGVMDLSPKLRAGRGTPPNEGEVALCREFIHACCTRTKTVRTKYDSYTYKHLVEEWSARGGERVYISNGAFIVAALREGLLVKEDWRGRNPNASVNLAVPWLRGKPFRYPEEGPVRVIRSTPEK